MKPKSIAGGALASILMAGTATAALTPTLVDHDTANGSTGSATTGPGSSVTLTNNIVAGEDMWDGGDTFIYYHEDSKRTGSWVATARVIGQTAAVEGRWGKGGIRASQSLDSTSSFAMLQIAAGNDSQATDFSPDNMEGDPPVALHSPVPPRLAGRTSHLGAIPTPGMFEDGIGDPQDIFLGDGSVNPMWIQLEYDEGANSYIGRWSFDVGGAPGAWTESGLRTDVPASPDGLYVGLAYSAHNSLIASEHGITFDNFSIVPEPSSAVMALLGMLGLVGLRRRR